MGRTKHSLSKTTLTHISLLVYEDEAPALEGGSHIPGDDDDVQLGEREGEVRVALHVGQEARDVPLQGRDLVQHVMPCERWKKGLFIDSFTRFERLKTCMHQPCFVGGRQEGSEYVITTRL